MEPLVDTIRRAVDRNAIAPLVDLVKRGDLFGVQAWIELGKAVNMPPPAPKKTRPLTPLEWAIDRGFHSLVQILLQAGAAQEPEGRGSPMERALDTRRYDLVQLLVEHGFEVESIDMARVFASWDPEIMNYIIEHGGDLRTGDPIAQALRNRIRTALPVYKRWRAEDEALQEQADIALRHHCYEGNLKWASLLLWAGADPLSHGTSVPGQEPYDDEDGGLSAIELAASAHHYEVLELKPIRSRLRGDVSRKVLGNLTCGLGVQILRRLLEEGLDPNESPELGCPAISQCIESMGCCGYFPDVGGSRWLDGNKRRKADTHETRDAIKAIHLLVKHGAKWRPANNKATGEARRALLGLTPDYTAELVWLLWKYEGSDQAAARELLRTPSIRAHTANHWDRLGELIANWPVAATAT